MEKTRKPSQEEQLEIRLGKLLHGRICRVSHDDMCDLDRDYAWEIGGQFDRRPEHNHYWMQARRILKTAKKVGVSTSAVLKLFGCL